MFYGKELVYEHKRAAVISRWAGKAGSVPSKLLKLFL